MSRQPRPATVTLKNGHRFRCDDCSTPAGWVHLIGRLDGGHYPPGPLVKRTYSASEVRQIAWQPATKEYEGANSGMAPRGHEIVADNRVSK
jgi:hypothetical protein